MHSAKKNLLNFGRHTRTPILQIENCKRGGIKTLCLYHRIVFLSKVYELLYSLGVTPNYIGFFQTSFAVWLCVDQPKRLSLVTKLVYPDVARQYKTSWQAVERNIRTVGQIIWKQSHGLLERTIGQELSCKPSNAQLLAILSYRVLSQDIGRMPSEMPGNILFSEDSLSQE